MTVESYESKSSYAKKLRSRKNLKTVGKNGKPLKTVTFPEAEEDLVRVHYVQTYKRWNYRQYIYVCSHLSYFDRSDLEGIEDEMDERFGIDGQEIVAEEFSGREGMCKYEYEKHEFNENKAPFSQDPEGADFEDQNMNGEVSEAKIENLEADHDTSMDLREEGEAELEEGEIESAEYEQNSPQNSQQDQPNDDRAFKGSEEKSEQLPRLSDTLGFQDEIEEVGDTSQSKSQEDHLIKNDEAMALIEPAVINTSLEDEPSCILIESSQDQKSCQILSPSPPTCPQNTQAAITLSQTKDKQD